ncbi:MAG: 5-histidylcysteine sulfoxide synthase, partial [Bacteriovoracaceae bacterium]|nr:5-histidylcysteine sulfoxide synthase [Bacteriovoracaceae bacterium]
MVVTITRNPNLSKPQAPKAISHELKNLYPDNTWWTGLAPENCPGFCKERNVLLALPLLNLKICSRQDVLDYFNNSWTLTELLFRGLKTEETYIRPPYHGLRHPMIFYYGHPAVLYVNKMRLAGLRKDSFNIYLEKVLETGVDEMSWDDMSKNEMSWPKVSEVREYRKTVYDFVINFIQNCPDLDLPTEKRNFLTGSPLWSLWMGMEHEKIHFETSSVLIRELPVELVETPDYWAGLHPSAKEKFHLKPIAGADYSEAHWKTQKGQQVIVGKPLNTESFGWDNEYGERKVEIKDFEYTNQQISNGEYFEFVASGAYVNDKYWAPEGLQWRKFRNTKRPTFWSATGPEGSHEYELRTIFEIIPMPWSWPCEVNYHEALAFSQWKKEKDHLHQIKGSELHYRLLTEAEFIALREKRPDPVLQKKPYASMQTQGDLVSFKENFNFVWGSPKPTDDSLYGNTWHWLMDQFNPLPGFEAHFLYDDFSTPCFDGKHQMILGGSFMSCGHEASQWARFHFRPHFYQHSGFRMARTLDGTVDNGATYLSTSKEYVHPKRQNVLDQMTKDNWWKNVEQP